MMLLLFHLVSINLCSLPCFVEQETSDNEKAIEKLVSKPCMKSSLPIFWMLKMEKQLIMGVCGQETEILQIWHLI